MLTMKFYLAESGEVASLEKDFPLYQGQFQNVLLNIYVPTSLLAPNFSVVSQDFENIITPFVAGTSVKIAMQTVARSGALKMSSDYYLRFVKVLVKDGVSYALYERKLPKEFTTYSGQGINAPTLICNVINIAYGEITSVSATTTGANITNVSATLSTIKSKFYAVSSNYVYTYNGTSWEYGDISYTKAELETLGISYSGTASEDDTITLSVTAETPTITSVLTSQSARLDVLPSSNLDADSSLSASQIAEIEALLNSFISQLGLKQDKVDNALQTPVKSVVGAINQLYGQIGTGENYIGTYNYNASSVLDLPSDAQMLAFVKSIKGATYELKGGETVIVVQKITSATDKNYKYIYNGTSWLHYEIPATQLALNGVAGIVEGTYNVGKTYDVLVDVQSGDINNIYVKVNGNYTALKDAFMPLSTGASKQYVKEYALPRQFNDVLYLTNEGYFPTFENHTNLNIETSSSAIGDVELLSKNYTLSNIIFQLASKNSYKAKFQVFATANETLKFRLTIGIVHNGATTTASVVLSDNISLVANQGTTLTFESNFGSLQNIVDLQENDLLSVKLEAVRTNSFAQTYTAYSYAVAPATFYLFTGVQAIITSQVVQETGTSTTNVMSQKATTDTINALKSSGTITSVASVTGGFLLTFASGLQLLLPIEVEGDTTLDVNAGNNGLVLSSASKLSLTLVSPSQTTGTLTEEQLAFLSSKDSNYIEVNDNDGHIEKYYYQTNATEDGYRVYVHLEDEAGSPSIKSFTITTSVKSWVIVETEIGGGSTYTAGDGIAIVDDEISVKTGEGLFFDANDQVSLNNATKQSLQKADNAVLFNTASQGLNDTQKANARTNIDASTNIIKVSNSILGG